MRKYIFIAFGGASGAILRFMIKSMQIYNYKENVPINTLIINIAGSFLLSMILTIALEVWEFDIDLRLGIATGFLGAFTTFSTLCKETVVLMQKGFYFSALSYVTISVMLGLFFAYFGIILAREVISKIVKDEKSTEYEGEIK